MYLDQVVAQRLEELLKRAKVIGAKTFSPIDSARLAVEPEEVHQWAASTLNLLQRVFGEASVHFSLFKNAYDDFSGWLDDFEKLRGILKAADEDYRRGYLFRLKALVAADLFADFLEMAEYLLGERYKDAAAVLIGGVLEEHLRKLCSANGIDTQVTDSRGTVNPKKADRMNADLARMGVYTVLDQKSITAWLDLRNRAAHGRFVEFTHEQVEILLQQVRDFLTRNPG